MKNLTLAAIAACIGMLFTSGIVMFAMAAATRSIPEGTDQARFLAQTDVQIEEAISRHLEAISDQLQNTMVAANSTTFEF